MKMEYFVKATHDAVVGQVKAEEGATVQMKQQLVTFKVEATSQKDSA
jgi:acetyl/propionyl-CoA carboxylase alpha subunit